MKGWVLLLELNPECKVPAFPTAFVERYRTADGPALKVALYLLLGNPADPEQMAVELQLPPDSIDRSLQFWHRAGLLMENKGQPAENDRPKAEKQIQPIRRKLTETELSSSLRNPEVAGLLQEAQAYLGRTISKNESERLLYLYECEELPVELILIVIAYSKERAKRSLISYVERIAAEWKQEGIDTVDKAEKHLTLVAKREERYRRVASLLELEASSLKYRDRNHIDRWFEEFEFSDAFVVEAYRRTNNNAPAYLNKVLESWSKKGYKTVKETRSETGNTPSPVPQRKTKGDSDLFLRALKETNEA